jgi:hypothetical protein
MTHVQNTIKGANTALKRSGLRSQASDFLVQRLPLGHVYLTVLLFSPVRPFHHRSVLTFHWPTFGKGKTTALTSLERPLKFQEVEAPRISRQSTHEDYKAVSPTYRPPLPPCYSFLWEAKSTPVWPKGLSTWKIPMSPSGNEHATCRLVTMCLNQPRHSVTHDLTSMLHKFSNCKCRQLNIPLFLTTTVCFQILTIVPSRLSLTLKQGMYSKVEKVLLNNNFK